VLTHVLDGARTKEGQDDPRLSSSLGCARVCAVRNYVGQDTGAGNLAVVALDLAGTLRAWELDANLDHSEGPAEASSSSSPTSSPTKTIRARHEATVSGACGTSLALPPRLSSEGPVVAAVGMLDGTVAIVGTGLSTPEQQHGAAAKSTPGAHSRGVEIGALVGSVGSRGSAVALCLSFRPYVGGGLVGDLAVGRQDGVVDIVAAATTIGFPSREVTKGRSHRLVRHASPVRAAAYTPDGHLLITGSDEGLVCVWDVSRGSSHRQAVPALVHHLQLTGRSWILNIVPLQDSRRFAVGCQDGTLSIWDLEHPGQASHTFVAAASSSSASIDTTTAASYPQNARPPLTPALMACCAVAGWPRLVAGNDAGYLQLFSIE
jgi:WD40 repeat protein